MSPQRSGDAEPVAILARRTPAQAVADAVPDVLALVACIVAWRSPHAFGIDLVRWTAPLFFVELPLALLTMFAVIRRVPDRELARRHKFFYVAIVAFVIWVFATLVFGREGFIAITWLGSLTLYRILVEPVDASPGVRGSWVAVQRDGITLRMSSGGGGRPAPTPGVSIIEIGHAELTAALTLAFWFMVFVGFLYLELPLGGLAPGTKAGTGALAGVDAQYALGCGVALFAVRTALHFERIDFTGPQPPTPTVEDDPVLREIVEKVEGKGKRRRS
jgi:hypothetical protein